MRVLRLTKAPRAAAKHVVVAHDSRTIPARNNPRKARMRVLRLTEPLGASARNVVAAHDSFSWDEIGEVGLDVVFLDFADPASANAGEGLIREIIACADPGAVDDAIRGYRALADEFIAPLSAFLSEHCRRKQPATSAPMVPVPPESLKRLKSLSKTVGKAQKVFDELLGEFAKQRSRELWPRVASTWQKLDGILTGLDLARKEAAGLQVKLAQLKIIEGIPPSWIIRPLLVGATERAGNSIKMRLDTFAAGRVVGLCRRIADVNTASVRFPVSTAEMEQVLRYDRLFNRSRLLSFHLPAGGGSPRALPKLQRDLEALFQAQVDFLREFRKQRSGRSRKPHGAHRTSEPTGPALPSAAESSKPQEAAKPASKPIVEDRPAPKEFHVVVFSPTRVEIERKLVTAKDARLALVGLAVFAGEEHPSSISFETKTLIDLIHRPGKNKVHRLWYLHKKAMKEQLPGVLIDGREIQFTIYGLSFEFKMPLPDLRKALKQMVHGPSN